MYKFSSNEMEEGDLIMSKLISLFIYFLLFEQQLTYVIKSVNDDDYDDDIE